MTPSDKTFWICACFISCIWKNSYKNSYKKSLKLTLLLKCIYIWPFDPDLGGGTICLAVTNPIYVCNSHTKFGWISFNGKGEDSIMDCDDARKYWDFFSRKVLLAYRSLQNLLEACIGGGQISHIPWSKQASIPYKSANIPIINFLKFSISLEVTKILNRVSHIPGSKMDSILYPWK